MIMEKYYSVEQVASMLKMHPKTIQRYLREGRLKAQKVGKSWRIGGHELSVFIEGSPDAEPEAANWPQATKAKSEIKISSVIDIDVMSKNEAIRIINTLTAALNGKPAEYGQSTLNAQIIESELKVRLMLWGGLAFMESMLATLALLTGERS